MEQSDKSINFEDIAKRIFTKDKAGKVFIGGIEITPSVLEALQDQALNLKTTQLYDILLCTLKNEAANLALVQSKNWDNVQFAKALHHVTYVLENLIINLTRK